MAKDFSFDIVSEADLTEVNNAINTATKEVANRFDFKGSISKITLNELNLELVADDDMRMKNLIQILEGKLVKRGIDLGFLDYQKVEDSLGGNVKQVIALKNGITTEKAKEINKSLRDAKIKVNPQIQGDKIRVASAKKDALQDAMQFLKGQDFGIVLEFNNFR